MSYICSLRIESFKTNSSGGILSENGIVGAAVGSATTLVTVNADRIGTIRSRTACIIIILAIYWWMYVTENGDVVIFCRKTLRPQINKQKDGSGKRANRVGWNTKVLGGMSYA